MTTHNNEEFKRCKFHFNSLVKTSPDWNDPFFDFLHDNDMLNFHRSLEGYAPTPLVQAGCAAESLGVAKILVKDESHRFGINAFKAFGASYAIYRFLKSQWTERFGSIDSFNEQSFKDPGTLKKLGSFTFCAATDGNHGRAVAWTANRLKQNAVIYMPDNTAHSRIDNIENENATVVLVPGTFDDCVKKCADDAEANGWQAISDTAYPGYMEIPKYIMLGYTSIFHELETTLHKESDAGVDFVFLPAGVGGLAAAGASFYTMKYGDKRPTLICVEPSDCDCFLESAKYGNGQPLPTRGSHQSIMAGLNCGIPSPIAWPIIRDAMHLFIAVTDNYAENAMRLYAKDKVISGESGSAGLAGLTALLNDPLLNPAKEKLNLNKNSRILLINTEGDTDPLNYQRIISGV